MPEQAGTPTTPGAADTAPGQAWEERYARQPRQAAETQAAADAIGDDFYSDDQILGFAVAAPGLVLAGRRWDAYEKSVQESLQDDGRVLRLLDQLKLGRALAEMGIRPSRGLSRLPAWARALGGLGAVAYVVGNGIQAAMDARPAPRPSPGSNGVARHPREAPGGS